MNAEVNIAVSLKKAVSEYVSGAVSLFESTDIPIEKAVHDTRVLLKKARAMALLLWSIPDSDVVRKEYIVFRDVARSFSSMRDSSVARKTLSVLAKADRKLFKNISEGHPIFSIAQEPPDNENETFRAGAAESAVILRKSLSRLRFIKVSDTGIENIFPEFEKTYTDCQYWYFRSRNTMRPKAIHRFRKKVKILQYQLPYLGTGKKNDTRLLKKKLENLSGELGRYNDMSVLLRKWGYEYGKDGQSVWDDALAALIKNCQDKYLGTVWPLAHSIFVHEPGMFRRREGE